jgi:hypothetical protein
MPANQHSASTADTVLAAEMSACEFRLLAFGGSLDNTDPAAGLRQLCVTAARPVRRQARHTVSATFRRFTLHEAVNVSTLPQEVG